MHVSTKKETWGGLKKGMRGGRSPGTWGAAIRERHTRRVPEPVVPTDQGISPGPARRALDLAVAVAILALVWPLFLLLAMATRLSTGGTAIYRQRRVRHGGGPVTPFHFRTLRPPPGGPAVTPPGAC